MPAQDSPSAATNPVEVVIEPMQAEDLESCVLLVFETFDFVLRGFVLDESVFDGEARLRYRRANLHYQIEQRGLQFKVARRGNGDRRVVGLSAYKIENGTLDDAARKPSVAPPQAPAGLDLERWRGLALQEDRYAESVYGKATRCDLWFLIVIPELQGTGLGTRLFDEYVRAAQGLPLFLTASPTAVKFYQRIGFKLVEQAEKDGGISIQARKSVGPPQPGELIWPMYRCPSSSPAELEGSSSTRQESL